MLKYKNFVLVAALAGVALTACASAGGPSPGAGLADLATFTKADLAAAENNAVVSNDAVAKPCYPALSKWIDDVGGQAGQIQVAGLFSGVEAGHAIVNGVDQGVPDYIYVACGPLYMRVQALIASKGIKAALLVH